MNSDTSKSPDTLTVYYDGSCPLCTREIAFFRNRLGEQSVDWTDVSCSTEPSNSTNEMERVANDLDREVAMARFHVRRSDGTLVSGPAAFALLWQRTPGLRWLGNLCVRPVPARLLEPVYQGFLKFRPLLQSLARRSTRR